MISFVLPTRDRPARLRQTLLALGRLVPTNGLALEGEVIVVDNASRATPVLPRRLDNGLSVTLLQRPTNEGAGLTFPRLALSLSATGADALLIVPESPEVEWVPLPPGAPRTPKHDCRARSSRARSPALTQSRRSPRSTSACPASSKVRPA